MLGIIHGAASFAVRFCALLLVLVWPGMSNSLEFSKILHAGGWKPPWISRGGDTLNRSLQFLEHLPRFGAVRQKCPVQSGAGGQGFAAGRWQDSRRRRRGSAEPQRKRARVYRSWKAAPWGELGKSVKRLCRLRNLDLVYRGQHHLLGTG